MLAMLMILTACCIPVFIELKVFDPAEESCDYLWNILKRVVLTFAALWIIGLGEAWLLLGFFTHPFAAPLQFAVLASVLAVPISIAGYIWGRRKE